MSDFEWISVPREERWLSSELKHWPELTGSPSSWNRSGENVPAAYACITLIADNVAQLPIRVVEHDAKTGTRKGVLFRHPIARALARPESLSSFGFLQSLAMSIAGWGNGFAEIVRSETGAVRSMRFVPPHMVSLDSEQPLDFYRVHDTRVLAGPGASLGRRVPKSEMIHVMMHSFDGIWGASPIEWFRYLTDRDQAIGDYAADFFSQGARIQGLLTRDRPASPEQRQELTAQIRKRYSRGGEEAAGLAVLTGGWTYQPFSPMKATDADYVSAKKLSVAEIAMVWRIPPHMLGFLENATLANVDALNRDLFLKMTLAPYLRALESELERKLLRDRFDLEVETDVSRYLRGSPKEQAEANQIRVAGGWLSRNEARAADGLEPAEGLDEMLIPSGVRVASELAEPEPEPEPEDSGSEVEAESERAFSVVRLRPDGAAGRV